MRLRAMLLSILTLALGFLAGCGPASATITGEVTVDGKPVENGVISYVPADGNGVPVTATILNGKYEVKTVVGKKSVQISVPVVIGRRKESNSPDAPIVELTEESLPEKYHAKTELTFEVVAGKNTKDWSVESNKRKP
jgi:hypothetical protein